MAASIWNPGTATSPSLPAVAPVQFVAGTESLPSITWVGDTNTGIWSAGDGSVGVASNGVNKVTIDAMGLAISSGALKLAPELAVASAATCDIGAVLSNSIAVTGTVSIGSFGTNYSGPKFLRFTASLVLSHSVNLALPGGAAITTGVGDTCIAIPKATAGVSDGWVVVSYQYASAASAQAFLDVYSKAQVYTQAETNAAILAASPQAQGFRNRVLNGDFSVDQEFAGASTTVTAAAALKYVIDGWYAWCTGANVTFQTITTAGRKRARFTGLAGNTLVGFATRIESINSADMATKFATISMLLSSSSITTVNWGLYYANTTNTFGTVAARTRTTIQTGTFAITSTEALYSAITSAILASGATTGLELEITVGALLATQTLTIGDAQVERGSVASPVFEAVHISEQQSRCKWVYKKITGASGATGIGGGRQTSTTSSRFTINIEEMRTVPTLVFGGTVFADVAGTVAAVTITTTFAGVASLMVDASHAAIGAAGQGAVLQLPSGAANFIELSSRL